jgi:lipopolysaccharide export system permease protein
VKLLDRLIIVAYFRSYFICLLCLLSLYIVIDLFTNLDNFFQGQGILRTLQSIGTFYMYQSSQIFDRMCEPVVLLAGTFTISWMQRNNELTPLLAAGVPTRRVLLPVLAGSAIMTCVGMANQEMVIPRIASSLVRDRDNLDGKQNLTVQSFYDQTGVHIEGHIARRDGLAISQFHCTIPDSTGYGFVHLSAERAEFIPPGAGFYSGGWLLTNTSPTEIPEWNNPKLARMIDPGKWFLYTQNADFTALTRNGAWYMFFSTSHLSDLLSGSDGRRMDAMAVLFHMRLTRPITGMLLVVMGLAVILRDPNRHVFVSTGYCLALCAVFFLVVYGCKFLGDHEVMAPVLSAWLPVLIFGPTAIVLFDAMHT